MNAMISNGLAALALLCTPIVAQAKAPVPPAASIPFADHHGVEDWRAVGDRTVYFEDQHRRWFKATLFSPAFDLPFAEAIGIDSGPLGTLDRFGAVVVRGQRYPFSDFVAVDGPPAKARAHKTPAGKS